MSKMRLAALILVCTPALSAAAASGAAAFRPTFDAIAAEMRRPGVELAGPEREWLDAVVAESTARFENWPRDPSLRAYLDRLDRSGPRLRAIGHFYLHTCLDLPQSIAAAQQRHPIPLTRATAIFRRSDFGVQRIFAGAVDLGRNGIETKLYRIFHSHDRTDALFRLLTDRVVVWRLSSWLNAQALDAGALRRSFDAIVDPVLRSSRDPIEWLDRLGPPAGFVVLRDPSREPPPLPAAIARGSAQTADFRALYAASTNFLRRYEVRLAPDESEWLESAVQSFVSLFEDWQRDPSLQPYLDRLDAIAASSRHGAVLRVIGHIYLHGALDLPRGVADSLRRHPISPARAGDIFRIPNTDFRRLFGEMMSRHHGGPGLRLYRLLHSRSRTDSLLRLVTDRLIVWRLTAMMNGQALTDPLRRAEGEDALRRGFDRITDSVMGSASRDPAEWLARLDAPIIDVP